MPFSVLNYYSSLMPLDVFLCVYVNSKVTFLCFVLIDLFYLPRYGFVYFYDEVNIQSIIEVIRYHLSFCIFNLQFKIVLLCSNICFAIATDHF